MLWTFMIYWLHRIAHKRVFLLTKYHMEHHRFILKNDPKWHWSNIFLYQDNLESTIDVWLSEVIPTIIFCLVFNQWWILLLFYIWSAFIQESIEHNRKFNVFPFSTSGKWHLIHHLEGPYNFGIFHPLWDILFKTYKPIK